MLEVRLLGQFDVRREEMPVAIPSRAAQSLFAYLVLTAGTTHRREKLAGLVWPDTTDENARKNLRHELWRLRQAIEPRIARKKQNPYLIVDEISIGFDAQADYWLDVAIVRNPLSAKESADNLIETLSLYRGELLPGLYDDWVVLERERVHAVYEQKMARLLELFIEEKRWQDILDWGERWIALGQNPEPAYRALMVAHNATGDQAKVATTFQRCVNALRNDLGVEPSAETQALFEQLSKGDRKASSIRNKSELHVHPSGSNLPVPLTSFIGREKELGEIAKLLSTARLLTLTGPGGVGKTRLAIQTANDSVKKFKDGVYWVGLVGLSDANLIPHEIAQSLNVREISNEPVIEALKTHLKLKEVLLVIDNCEHLIKACAQYTEQLLAACPKLKILATSIEALGLFNETIWQVPSLPLPEMSHSLSVKELSEFASIQLFHERARNAKTGFELDERNATSVAQICRRLDGIPLAIELAAARLKVLSVDEIAARLDNRFSLLTAGSRTAIPRHQTLRATIDWSYELLSEPERIVFRRLSIFAGGFTLDATEAVCSQGIAQNHVLDLLGRLIDKSLVIVEENTQSGETRYRLLETIRQYALEKLVTTGEASEIRDRHLVYYSTIAEKAEPLLFSGEHTRWLRLLDTELDNVRAAIEWATSTGKAEVALRIAGSLVYYWFSHRLGASEWQDWLQKALACPEGQKRTLARAKALNGIGFIYFGDVVPTDRRPELEEALSIAREFGDQWNIATALRNLGLMENVNGNYSIAQTYLEHSLAIWHEIGLAGKIGRAWTLVFLGDVALNQGEAAPARSLYEEAITILRDVGELNFLAYAVRRLGQLLWRGGEYKKGIALCKESLDLNQQVGSPRGVIGCLAGFAAIAVAQGRYQYAAQLMAAVETQMASLGITPMYMDRQEYVRNLTLLRSKLDAQVLDRFWRKGKKMSLEETITFALEVT